MDQFPLQRALPANLADSSRMVEGVASTVAVMDEDRTLREQFPIMAINMQRVFGLCPGCHNWQLEPGVLATNSEVEEVLLEHARECPGLTRIAMENAIPIYPRQY